MPLTATYEDIKAYQEQVEKNKITPHGLAPCPRCNLESLFFKLHAYRERRFLVIVDMLVQAVFCSLVRFRCTDCGKTITRYPDFAIPHKHYTRQTIESFSRAYVEKVWGRPAPQAVDNAPFEPVDHQSIRSAVEPVGEKGIPRDIVLLAAVCELANLTCEQQRQQTSKRSR